MTEEEENMENNDGNKLGNMGCMFMVMGLICAIGAVALFILSRSL